MTTTRELQDKLLSEFLRRLKEGEVVRGKDGEVHQVDAPASTLSAAINYLKLVGVDDGDLPRAQELSNELKRYGTVMPASKTTN